MGNLNAGSLANSIYGIEEEDELNKQKRLIGESNITGMVVFVFIVQMLYPHSDPMLAEEAQLLNSLQKCLELRDKYMSRSLQRLGDDPRDYDGHFQPFEKKYACVSGVRPDTPLSTNLILRVDGPNVKPWKIYPEPPPPHWHWKDKPVVNPDGTIKAGDEFHFEKCSIPGLHQGWSFKLDERGVYQVYGFNKGQDSCAF